MIIKVSKVLMSPILVGFSIYLEVAWSSEVVFLETKREQFINLSPYSVLDAHSYKHFLNLFGCYKTYFP